MKEYDVLVVPTGISESFVVGDNVYICPDESAYNHKECVFLAPYGRQQIARYAPILKRIRHVVFTVSNNVTMPQSYKDNFLPNSRELQDEKIRLSIANWYRSEISWKSDWNRKYGIQIYVLGDWIELDNIKQPRKISDNRFRKHRYASIIGLYNKSTIDEACEF